MYNGITNPEFYPWALTDAEIAQIYNGGVIADYSFGDWYWINGEWVHCFTVVKNGHRHRYINGIPQDAKSELRR